MRLFNLIAGALLTFLALPAAASAKAVVLEPQSGWALDSDAESCALVRVFDDGKGVVQLELRQFSPGGAVQVQVVATARRVSGRDHMAYRFDPQPEWQEISRMTFGYLGVPKQFEGVTFDGSIVPPMAGEKPVVRPPNDPKMLERIGASLNTIDALSLSDAFGDDLTLHTGSLAEPFIEMRQCLNKVMQAQGLDPIVQATLTKTPLPLNLMNVARAVQKAYPKKQLYAGRSATINVRLSVDASGATSGCTVHAQLADDAFSKAACRELMAMKFEPALDAKAQPVASYWNTRVYYWVDGITPEPDF